MSRTLTITCEHCGKQFESDRKKRYCSKKCEQRAYHKRNYVPVEKKSIIKTCVHCGREFVAHKETALYCSAKCRRGESYLRNDMQEKYCPVCGKEIKYGERHKKYCSEHCQDVAHTKICKECGKEFVPKLANGYYRDSQLYCSAECANNARKDKTLYVCKQCGKTFHRRKTETDRCDFCSRECSAKYKSEHRPMVQKQFFFGFPHKCEQCGKSFFSLSKDATFCSKECRKQWKNEHAAPIQIYYHECQQCGRIFISPQKNRKYCSEECQKKAYDKIHEIRRRTRKRINGDADYSISLSKLCKRDHGICAICGEKVNMKADPNSNEYGSIDHIIPLAKGGKHTWDNVQLTHRICNSNKRDII